MKYIVNYFFGIALLIIFSFGLIKLVLKKNSKND